MQHSVGENAPRGRWKWANEIRLATLEVAAIAGDSGLFEFRVQSL